MTQSTNNFSNARDASRARRKALSQSGKSAISPTRSSASQKQLASPAPAATAALQAGMYQPANSAAASGKAASIARRQAMSSRGKAGVISSDRTREDSEKLSASRKASPEAGAVAATASGANAECGCGCNGEKQERKTQIADTSVSAAIDSVSMMKNIRRQANKVSSGRAASFARREAMSKRGKAGISSKGLTAAQTARATNPDLSSRELAMTLREQRSRKGRCGEKKSEPCGRVRPGKNNKNNGAAQDAPWKVGASETTHGQILTGTMVGRSSQVTGDEPSTCRDVTGTDYLGADMFRDFCQSEPEKAVRKVDVTSTMHGNPVSGNKIGRGENVTGNEAGSCKSVTGNEYLSSNESEAFCGTKSMPGPRKVSVAETGNSNTLTGSNVGRSEKVTGDEPGSNRLLTGSQYTQPTENTGDFPVKVGLSKTLRGGSVSGTLLDRTEHVTGNEAGTCRNVTGDDYLSQEQFKGFCESVPQPADNKVEVSTTGQGNSVTGVMTSRSKLVTGNEPGTCKSVTGTPYTSVEQTSTYCEADEIKKIDARTPVGKAYAGADISGIQPAIGGAMTGDSKGACEPVSGTPYVSTEQLTQACSSQPADFNSADFPQPLASAGSVQSAVLQEPAPAPLQVMSNAVTGSSYGKGNITGPFGMADGKVTGTEQARFGDTKAAPGVASPVMPVGEPMLDGRVKSRISGEGMDAGTKITGNDWDRGDHVTGTEGTSAIQRNPTFHGVNARAASSVSVMKATKRNDDVPVPVSKVTGSSGNTVEGSLVTYSGGARG